MTTEQHLYREELTEDVGRVLPAEHLLRGERLCHLGDHVLVAQELDRFGKRP